MRVEVGPRDLAERQRHARPPRHRHEGAGARRRAPPGPWPTALDAGPGATCSRAPGPPGGAHRRRGRRRRGRRGGPDGFARVPWAALGAEGEARLAADGVTVRCLRRPDGSRARRRRRARPRRRWWPGPTEAAGRLAAERRSELRPGGRRRGYRLGRASADRFAWPRSDSGPVDGRGLGPTLCSSSRDRPLRRRSGGEPRRTAERGASRWSSRSLAAARASSSTTSSWPAPPLRVLVDRPGGVDLDALGEVTRAVSGALDADDPLPGRYTLEVSSPGLERPLRTPGALRRPRSGKQVPVKTVAGHRGRPPGRGRARRGRRRRRRASPRPTGERRLGLRRRRAGPHRVRVGPDAAARPGKRRQKAGRSRSKRAEGPKRRDAS